MEQLMYPIKSKTQQLSKSLSFLVLFIRNSKEGKEYVTNSNKEAQTNNID